MNKYKIIGLGLVFLYMGFMSINEIRLLYSNIILLIGVIIYCIGIFKKEDAEHDKDELEKYHLPSKYCKKCGIYTLRNKFGRCSH